MSEIKVNKISPRTNCGTTTLGDSGDTFTIPAGVSITNSGTASGFGATGSASWNTTVKTGDFTAVAGEGYFVNTTSGEIDVTLPAGTAGAVVAVADYANTADTNNIILKQNGSDKIEGSTDDFTINVEGAAITLVFVDATKGWITTDTGNSTDAFAQDYIVATGGTETTCGDCKIHTFTGPGTFSVTSKGTPIGSDTVNFLVVGGGGGSGATGPNSSGSGGGGAGGYRTAGFGPGPLQRAALGLTVTDFPITVGAAGAASPSQGGDGGSSTFSTITSAGGGGGGHQGAPTALRTGRTGGSGGGGGDNTLGLGGAGNTPPVSPPQGNPGGQATAFAGAGGGGATAAGSSGSGPTGGAGGAGAPNDIKGTASYAGGGGGGGYNNGCGGAGGAGGGGAGSNHGDTPAGAGTANTGGGAGGSGNTPQPEVPGANGGSGIVVIRYKFQN
jgi:hypothetical protein